MKITHRIPSEMYAYVEIEQDIDVFSPEAIRDQHDALLAAFKARPDQELSEKEFNTFLDNYLKGERNHVEVYQQMSPDQKNIIQAIKRSLARIKSQQNKQ